MTRALFRDLVNGQMFEPFVSGKQLAMTGLAYTGRSGDDDIRFRSCHWSETNKLTEAGSIFHTEFKREKARAFRMFIHGFITLDFHSLKESSKYLIRAHGEKE